MHYIDRAIEYDKMLKKLNMTNYQYARKNNVNAATIGTYTRFLNLSERVLTELRNSKVNLCKAGKLLKLRHSKSDDRLIKIIRFNDKVMDAGRRFTYFNFKTLCEKEMMEERN